MAHAERRRRGRVLIPGTPLTPITVDRTALRTQATSSGSYVLVGVPTGRQTTSHAYQLRATAQDITVRANESTTQDFPRRSTVRLRTIAVVVGRAHHKAADEVAVPVDIIPPSHGGRGRPSCRPSFRTHRPRWHHAGMRRR